MQNSEPLLLDTITDLDHTHAGQVVVAGSHGGLYAANLASRGGVRAVILNDAGIGLDGAGAAGVMAAAQAGLAAAAAAAMSCEIGLARDMMQNGVISRVNAVAKTLGLVPNMPVAEAAALLAEAAPPTAQMPALEETRREVTLADGGPLIVLVDSASLVRPEDAGRIVVTGSHGGLVGRDATRGFKARARIAVFNDAGYGRNNAGISRLPALDEMGVAGLAVSHRTARIGDAQSALESGVISAVNKTAQGLGAHVDMPLADWLAAQ